MKSNSFYEKLRDVSPVLNLLLIIASGIFFYFQINKKADPVTVLTGSIDDKVENAMKNMYLTGVNDDGSINTYKTNLYGQLGIMHNLTDLLAQLKLWKLPVSQGGLGIDSVDFRFSVVPKSDAEDKGKLTVILLPAIDRNNRYPYIQNKPASWAVDLGDLHP